MAHTKHSIMPLNVTTINEKIMETNLPADLKPDAIVKAIATAVLNPAHLFVHLKEHTDVLLNLAPKIDNLYNAQANAPEWVMPEATAKVGRYCVAKYKGRWLRAQIVRTEPNHQCVLLHYVDYGYRRYVPLSELRYMMPELAAIPCQVVRIALAHLNPSEGTWTDACVQHVANAVRGRVFYMRIVNVHKKDNALDVIFGDWVSELRGPNGKSFNRQLAVRSDIVYSE
uniref:Tudor domain-containing protein n=1 Tax=Anopheles dirus TaxID=7168 RepID=A0A182NTJ4_9DIPT